MKRKGIGNFKYYVGISSLEQLATREDRVCVLNLLGGESRTVSPVSHTFSGGNIVFGTSPGRAGQVLKTKKGNIPVYNNVREGLEAGHHFNTGVVYLPPSGVRDGVAELVRVNPELRKVIILTEKVAVHDAREIRAIGQMEGIDIFGANCLGLADSWNRVRLGGALGGDHPEESLIKGSVAIFSNSGNFTTTIAQYLATGGWGTTTSISSGKDVYIHFAAPEFIYAFSNDQRSKAAVMYVEPGGYYEHDLQINKPIVACVVGRWKSKLNRAVGHAGAMAGSGDDAEAKEKWFMEAFGVNDIFTPENRVFSEKGAVVTNIAHIPLALTEVMNLSRIEPDFEPMGDLSLKSWFGDSKGLALPAELDVPTVEAIPPYKGQIQELNKQIGRIFPRTNMKDASGVSIMDPKTQITKLHGRSILDNSLKSLESNLCFALLREHNGPNDNALTNIAIAAQVNLYGEMTIQAADTAREAGNAPNTVLSAAIAMIGPNRINRQQQIIAAFIDLFSQSGLKDGMKEDFDLSNIEIPEGLRKLLVADAPDEKTEAILSAITERNAKSLFVKLLRDLQEPVHMDAVLAAIAMTIAWSPLARKRISKITAKNFPWYLTIYATLIGASVDGSHHQKDSYCGIPNESLLRSWTFGEIAYLTLLGNQAAPEQLFAFQVLTGLLVSNGPGSISSQGSKGAVAADGPETPNRVQINKAMIGFLTHTGFSHGGAGFEGVTHLVDAFKNTNLTDPSDPNHGLDLTEMARSFAIEYGKQKAALKESTGGRMKAIAGLNHPVFKNKPVNTDPREVFIDELFKKREQYNVFHEYYQTLARQLFEAGVTHNVFCVNIDGVIGAMLLKMLWSQYREGQLNSRKLEVAAFTIFLYGRMMGCAAEINDHINRGKNMDTRTPASQCRYVS